LRVRNIASVNEVPDEGAIGRSYRIPVSHAAVSRDLGADGHELVDSYGEIICSVVVIILSERVHENILGRQHQVILDNTAAEFSLDHVRVVIGLRDPLPRIHLCVVDRLLIWSVNRHCFCRTRVIHAGGAGFLTDECPVQGQVKAYRLSRFVVRWLLVNMAG